MANNGNAPVKAEHRHLHDQIGRATYEPGLLGDTAREVMRLIDPHFEKEERYAMPPLTLLSRIAWGTVTQEMAAMVPVTRRLKAELPLMLMEHKSIAVALERFHAAATAAGRADFAQAALDLERHAKHEEEVLYPAAILVGEFLELVLRPCEKA